MRELAGPSSCPRFKVSLPPIRFPDSSPLPPASRFRLTVLGCQLFPISRDVFQVLREGGGKKVTAVAITYEVERIAVRRAKRGAKRTFPGIGDRSRRQTSVDV